MDDIKQVIIPENHTVTGTCGKCGGPIISPLYFTTSSTDINCIGTHYPERCLFCGATPKVTISPDYGPVREMNTV